MILIGTHFFGRRFLSNSFLCVGSLRTMDRTMNRLRRDWLGRNRLKWDRVEWGRLEWDRLEWNRLEWDRLDLDRLEQDKLGEDRLDQDRLERDRLERERLERNRLESRFRSTHRFTAFSWRPSSASRLNPGDVLGRLEFPSGALGPEY